MADIAPNEIVPISRLQLWERNPRSIKSDRFNALKARLSRQGQIKPLLVAKDGKTVIGGNMRLRAMLELGITDVWISQTDAASDKDIFDLALTDNEEFGYYEREQLAELALELDFTPLELDSYAISLGEPTVLSLLLQDIAGPEQEKGNLADDFIVPPFSVLDTRQGYWQKRKRNWLDLGITSEIGRADNMVFDRNGSPNYMGERIQAAGGGSSIFDPVLCEIAYRWFNIAGGTVLDPFAGGSVRGVIASKLGYAYTGHELRAEQVEANRVQANDLCADPLPTWIAGDSNVTLDSTKDTYDMILSCPPYADLEVYSDDPADLSNMPYADFIDLYRSIIRKAADKLKDDRFVVWVVGEVRGKDGAYYDFVGDTIRAFMDVGLHYYNEMILVNAVGTLALRAPTHFNRSRKIGKGHQNVLVFYKGNMKAIKGNYPALDFSSIEDMFSANEE